MYTMGALLRHGSDQQRAEYLPKLVSGELRLQAFAVTEPTAGSDTTKIQTTARPHGDGFVLRGQKVFTSRAEHSDLMLVLARTDLDDGERKVKTDGLSLFLVDMAQAGERLVVRPIETMINHCTTEVFFDDVEVPGSALVGEEGKGFRYILDGWNAERVLIAAERIGDGRWFIERASEYSSERVVFESRSVRIRVCSFRSRGRMRRSRVETCSDIKLEMAVQRGNCRAAPRRTWRVARRRGPSREAANACLDTHGGYGFVAEYDVERKFRETRLYKVAPVSNNLVLAYLGQHVLGMPRST